MGVDMEIDLFAGLAKPKTALPTLENPEPLEGALPDFSALLDGAQPDSLENPDATPDTEMPALLPVALPQLAAPDMALKSEAKTAESIIAEPEVPKSATVSAAVSATALLPEAPLTPRSEPAIQAEAKFSAPSVIAQPPLGKIIAEPSVSTQVFKPDSTPAPFVNPEPRVAADMGGERIVTEAMPATTAPNTTAEPKTAAAVMPALPFDKASGLPAKTPVEPILDAPLAPVKITAKTGVQASPQPTPAVGFANIEAVVEDLSEMQFGIKIERQTIETAPTSRATQQATPVASQISAQLPQLLTKAEKQTVELRLDPPELGRVTIHLSTNDTQVTAQVVAERVDTIDLMRRHAELLSATLARAGFSQADLSFQQGHGQGTEDEPEQFKPITGFSESEGPTASVPTLTGQDGRLDIRL